MGWLALVERDPLAAAAVAGVVAAVVAVGVGGQRLLARRVRARRRQMPAGSGVWRANLDGAELGVGELLGGGSLRAVLLGGVLAVDVVVAPTSLQLVPTWTGRALAGVRPARIAWDEIAEVSSGEPVWELDGKPRFTPLTPVRLLVVGPRVEEFHRPVTDAEALEEGWSPSERAAFDAEMLADAREQHGEDYRFGTMPLALLVTDPEGLVPLLSRYCRGALPED